jgi:hypothetical protein
MREGEHEAIPAGHHYAAPEVCQNTLLWLVIVVGWQLLCIFISNSAYRARAADLSMYDRAS